MSDKKKQLLEEAAVRKFMKIAGTGKLSDGFVKSLKEESTGRGKIFDPHGDDPRHENLNEEVTEEGADLEEEVTEEGTDLEEEVQEEGEVQEESEAKTSKKGGAGKNIAGGKGLSGAGKKVSAKMQYEAKGSIVSKGPGKAIESGKGMNGSGKKVTAKMQYEEVQEEGDQLQEFEDMEAGGGMGGEELPPPDMGAEEPVGGGGDLQGLVQAIAAAISAHTGVQVSVEGGEGDVGDEEEMPPPPDMGGEEEMPVDDGPPMEETGLASYKAEDPRARQMTSGQMQEGKRKAKTVAKTVSQKQKDQIVETITKNVLAKLTGAVKKKTTKR